MTVRRNAFAIILLSLCASVRSDERQVDFKKQIVPIFAEYCVRCHSPGNSKGDVSLATFDDLKSNDFVNTGDPDGSYLIELVTSQDGEPPVMPKESNPLSDAEVDLLRQWTGQGAKWPDGVVVKQEARADASWWAYQPLRVPRHSESSMVCSYPMETTVRPEFPSVPRVSQSLVCQRRQATHGT